MSTDAPTDIPKTYSEEFQTVIDPSDARRAVRMLRECFQALESLTPRTSEKQNLLHLKCLLDVSSGPLKK